MNTIKQQKTDNNRGTLETQKRDALVHESTGLSVK